MPQTQPYVIVPRLPESRIEDESQTRRILESWMTEAANAINQGISSVASPAALASGNNNNFDPGNDITTLRLSADGAGSIITGISKGSSLRKLRIVNVSANTLTLAHQDSNSDASNRLLHPAAASPALLQNDVADLEYDATTVRWRVVNVLQ